ncbi:lytic transglycosylase domain-containing protein [Kibdelosporangium persicum]|uniref:Membrane-bound lytic murein transglycosylase B n=1 Tax=Kibdelosporangium persicum TaxID=2698649 RepID=A0ABX2F9R6_9PSEU|nr:lytic murein transglycosylase [Kibdelosporangium persicum]NRN67874.1 Membrane-bound lytic murein transglycosylase B [Kibdelosporangium persicum]
MTSSLPIAPPEAPRRRPQRRRPPRILIIGLLLGVVVAAYLVLRDSGDDRPARQPAFSVPGLSPAARTTLPFQAPPIDMARVPELSRRMQIPERMLIAYGKAEELQRQVSPACGISWTMLAGIGRKESFHGKINSTAINPDGTLSKPIIGVPLDGSPGFRAIRDTDGGVMDQDTTWDRAVGPMQFLPSTWKRWAVRVSGDGQPADPQNVDDAAATAARYLCAEGNNLTDAQGWWKAVLTYNESVSYARDVFSGQDAYARAVQQQ